MRKPQYLRENARRIRRKARGNDCRGQGAKIGKNCIVDAGALVTENKEFPDNSLILVVPAKKVGDIDDATAKKSGKTPCTMRELRKNTHFNSIMTQKTPDTGT
ncbi:MAG: hypothetical protein ACI4N4_05980 [Candidatus Fimenecus sp.]